MIDVQLELPRPASFTHLGLVLTGLVELQRTGRIRLHVARQLDGANALVLRARLSAGGSPPRRIVFDMLDRSDRWDLEALRDCDAYLKRSWHRPDVDGLGPLGQRVRSFGLNFLVRTPTTTRWVLRHAVAPELAHALGTRSFDRHARAVEYRGFFRCPELDAFEVPPHVPAPPRVVFQTRVWNAGELAGEASTLNDERVAMVRALRRAFGPRFTGGLVPTPLARERWPAEVSDAPTARRAHLAWMHSGLIAIYTRGLHHSTAFKLPEYFAASRCVVAEPVRNGTPAPLVPGRHLLEFRSAEECVERCGAVLDTPELTRTLREAAWAYWREEVRPERVVARRLDEVLSFGELTREGRTVAS